MKAKSSTTGSSELTTERLRAQTLRGAAERIITLYVPGQADAEKLPPSASSYDEASRPERFMATITRLTASPLPDEVKENLG